MSCWPDEYVPLYGCSTCCLDFVSLDAFDRHRIGSHDHRFSVDHLEGRRCLDREELQAVGLHVLEGEALAASRYRERARFGVVLVHDPEAAERVRRVFANQEPA